MSPAETYTSRKGEVPCGDRDLYSFLTDMRNFRDVLPEESIITDWEATEDSCSFKVEKTGKITVSLNEALPHSMISYKAETFLTGSVNVQVMIEYLTNNRSVIYIVTSLNMNPIVKMLIGNSAALYLDNLIDAIENYGGYDKIRGCNQSP
jgi:hypothetical protein